MSNRSSASSNRNHDRSAEKFSVHIADPGDGDDPDRVAGCFKPFYIIPGYIDAAETQLVGFGDPLFHPGNGPYLAAKSHFSGKTAPGINGGVLVRGEHGGDHGKVGGRIVNPDAAGDVEEYILVPQKSSL